jgi:hypothetical protein
MRKFDNLSHHDLRVGRDIEFLATTGMAQFYDLTHAIQKLQPVRHRARGFLIWLAAFVAMPAHMAGVFRGLYCRAESRA